MPEARVLIIDDETTNVAMLERILHRHGDQAEILSEVRLAPDRTSGPDVGDFGCSHKKPV
jgi:hypothetical protein